MYRRIISVVLIMVILLLSLTIAYATPPAHPHIGSGSASDGGNYFEYRASSGWKNLKTPPHWVIETGEVAYCVDHKADSPSGDETYSAFNPQALYSSRTYSGLLAILKAGYPYQTGGLSSKQARYSTANAIRTWLSESAGIGYKFMNLSRGYVRPKSGQQATYNFMLSLVNKARNNQQPAFSISTNPSSVKLSVQGNKLVGQVTVVFNNINGYYSVDSSKLPSGVAISGCTGKNGDVLTITAPISYAGQTIKTSNLLEAHDTRATSNMYWFKPSSNEQPVLVLVTDTTKPVARGSLTFHSDAFGYIEIYKKDAVTNNYLNGAVFKVLDSHNGEVDWLTTNAQGYAKSNQLAIGKYKLQELTAPTGYLLDTTIQEDISVLGNETTSINLTNEQPIGIIRIHKTNTNINQGDYVLGGAVFEIRDNSDMLVDTVTTNNQGDTSSKNLPLGTYKIKEIKAPEGFVLNNNIFTVELEYVDQTTPVVYGNVTITGQPQVGSIKLQLINLNKSLGDYSLECAEFSVVDENSDIIDTITTDENGLAVSKELPLGKYSIKQINAPYGFILNTDVFNIDLEYGGQEKSVVYGDITIPINPKTGFVNITKCDSETGNVAQGDATLKGAVYEIYDKDGNAVERLESICDKITSQALPLGLYTVKEVEPPNGYLLNETVYTIENNDYNQTIPINQIDIMVEDNVIKGQMKINKVAECSLAGQSKENPNPPIEGVVFEIRHKNSDKVVDTVTTDVDGAALSKMLPYGEYTVTEVSAPKAYMISKPFEVFISQHDKVYEYTVENKVHKSKLKIIKVDSATNKVIPVGGVQFIVKDSDGEYISQQGMDVFTTDDTGKVLLKEPLIYGGYTLHEVKSPHGYWLNKEPVPFSITKNSGEILTVRFENTLIEKKIKVTKVDERDSKRLLSGAVFEVRNSDNELVETITTDEDGTAATSLLTVGEYTITETKAPVGFILDDLVINQNISDDEDMVYNITIVNKPTEVVITKTDVTDDATLQNANIEVYNSDNELVFEGDTNENGELIIRELPVGKYTFKETIAPDGYILNEKVYKFEILENGDIIGTTNIQNSPTEVVLSKTDIIDGIPVQGAEFEIFDAKNDSVFKGKTDENGKITITHLPVGDYTFVESQAPKGYIVSKEVKAFSIDKYGVVSGDTEMTNSPTALRIVKVKYEDNTPLTGAGFLVKNWLGLNTVKLTRNDDGTYRYNPKGDIKEVLVDKDGQATIYGLPLGIYWLEESTVPEGYYPTAPVKVTIGETNDIEKQYEAVIPNSVFVKLGLDRERYIYPLVAGLLIIIAVVSFIIIRRRRTKKNLMIKEIS